MTSAEIIARLHINPGNSITFLGSTIAAMLTCMFCWSRGGPADRIASVVFGLGWIGSIITMFASGLILNDVRSELMLVWDVIPAVAFFYLAVRYGNLWFGFAMAAQGVQLAARGLDAYIKEPMGDPVPFALAIAIGLLNFVMMAAMIGSAATANTRRGPRRPQAA